MELPPGIPVSIAENGTLTDFPRFEDAKRTTADWSEHRLLGVQLWVRGAIAPGVETPEPYKGEALLELLGRKV